MEFDDAEKRLEASSRLLSAVNAARIVGVHLRTMERWIKEGDFPKPATDVQGRLWRPDEILGWVRRQREANVDMIGIAEVCTRVGLHPETWHQWVKQGKAPASVRRELGTGRLLWSAKEIDAWLKELTGGYAFPNTREYSSAKGKRGPKPRAVDSVARRVGT